MDQQSSNAVIDDSLDEVGEPVWYWHVVEAVYRGEPGLEFLALRWNDGHRMLIPKEMLGELKNASPEQASEIRILTGGLHLYWPQLDDGLHLPEFLEYRWGKELQGMAA